MASKPLFVIVGLSGALAAQAHEPITTKLTWTQEISRIIYKRCASCHRDGGSSFSLASYDEARPWAKAIREEVLERRMPPWGAVEGVRSFRGDPSLTALEIEMLVSWVEGGAPEGDPVYLPAKPVFDPPDTHAGSHAEARPEFVVKSTAPLVLRWAVSLTAVRPEDLADGASMEVTAYEPGGEVEHLIWLRRYREEWTRTYRFREPLRLPAGTRIVVESTVPAEAALWVER